MGLDITAYESISRAPDGDLEDLDLQRLYVNDDFPGRADELKDGVYLGCGRSVGFRAGSYGGYNVWRDNLAILVGHESAKAVWDDPKPGPFAELINFSDAEGTIGAAVSKKLAADFAEWQSKADAHADEWFRDRYRKWREAFELASLGGAVCFY